MTNTAFDSATGSVFAAYNAVASPGDDGSGHAPNDSTTSNQTTRPTVQDRVARMWPVVQ